MTTSYTVHNGSLPPGSQLIEKGTHALITGAGAVENGPSWNGSTDLGNYNENTVIDLTINATPSSGRSLDTYYLVGYRGYNTGLPFGLVLDSVSGRIHGTAAKILIMDANPWSDSEQPLWVSDTEYSASTGDTVDIQLYVQPRNGDRITDLWVVQGSLPSGLYLNSGTGQITGRVSEVYNTIQNHPIERVTPYPVWTTPAGPLGVYFEKDQISTSVSAYSMNNGTITDYFIINGWLPPGVILNPTTGEISGTCSEIQTIAAIDPNTDFTPVFNNSTTDLGYVHHGYPVSFDLSATPYYGRSIVGYWIQEKTIDAYGLPFGLWIDATTGHVTGTPYVFSNKKFTFTVCAVDNTGAVATATYSLTTNAPPVISTIPLTVPLSMAISKSIVTQGDLDPMTVNVTGLPPGLSITSAGVITGTATSSGDFIAHITATDGKTTVSADVPISVQSVDPLGSYVELQLRFDGNYTNLGSHTAAPTVIDTISYDSSTKLYGSHSLNFDGNSGRLEYRTAPPCVVTNSFTVEMWIYLRSTAGSTTSSDYIISYSNSNTPWSINYYNKNFIVSGNSPSFSFTHSATCPTDQWYHLALVRDDSLIRLFVNGDPGTTSATTSTAFGTGQYLKVGGQMNGRSMDGNMDELRITSTVRYTTSFIPSPMPFLAPK